MLRAAEGTDVQTRQTNGGSLTGPRVSNVYKQVSGCGGSAMLAGQKETSYSGGPKSKASSQKHWGNLANSQTEKKKNC